MIEVLTIEAIELLQNMIAKPSFSSEEDETAKLIMQWLSIHDIKFERNNHNIWAKNKFFDSTKPTILLNSHHDTVKPNKAYSRDPFQAEIIDGKLYGLGSNDAGGSLVALLAAFTHFYQYENLNYNLIVVASAEEESSGDKGLNSMLSIMPAIDVAIVGEPTLMQLAIAEKGLLVLDCYAHGTAGHAAHGLGDNAIYLVMKAVNWFRTYEFPKVSDTLGRVKMTVTQINAGTQHNVIPAKCHFVVDIRVTDAYSNQEILDTVKENVDVKVKERSLRLNSSSIPINHELVKAGIALRRNTYGSPTLSDQSVLTCPSLKLGPGDSLRSHTADEFIFVNEIEEGIKIYIDLLNRVII